MPDRFDKFSERARRVLEFAQQEAQGHQHGTADTEHLLLGILDEGEGVAAKALATIAGDLAGLRSAVEARMAPAEETPNRDPALAPAARRTIELAVDEARRLNHGYIGTEHILLGMLSEDKGTAAAVLSEHGVTIERARGEVTSILQQSQPRSATPSFRSTIRSEGPDPAVTMHLAPELRPLYTLVHRLRAAKDAALFAGKHDILEVVRAQEEAMQRLLEERVTAALGAVGAEPAGVRQQAYPDGLSAREVEILRLIAAGSSNREIAERLVISANTVEVHVRRVLTKTGCTDPSEVAAYARRHGLL